ncbi:MAG: hypothetical protein JWM49_783 [Microbacteriaceae bacterium]|nr:hypothetical protein [Microbacteriaceae bacterium]
MAHRTRIDSRARAVTWEDGVVVGTGTLGAVLFGSPEHHEIQLTHEQFLVPAYRDVPAPLLSAHLPAIRSAVLEHREEDAADIVERVAAGEGYGERPEMTDPFVPIAALVIEPADQRAPESGSEYSRWTHFVRAESAVRWGEPGYGASVTMSADRDGERILVTVASENPRAFRFRLQPSWHPAETPVLQSGARIDWALTTSPGRMTATTRVREGERVRDGLVAVALTGAPPIPSSELGDLLVHCGPGRAAVIEIRASVAVHEPAGRFPDAVPIPRLNHADLVQRSTLDLRSGTDGEHTESLLDRARAGDPDAVRGALEVAFAAGRAGIIASSGLLPPNLTGVWQGGWSPHWSSDYTINGNVQWGALAAAVSTGTPELLLPLIRLIERFSSDFAENAQRLCGLPGLYVPARVTTHGRANHFMAEYPHEFWLGGGAWMLRMMYEYVSATGDEEVLRQSVWPFAVGVNRFYTALIERSPILAPSYSPENTPPGWANPLTVNATSEVAMIRDALLLGGRLASMAGQSAPESWSAARDLLSPYRVASDGMLAEWIDSRTPNENAHRHQSHLYGLYYEGDESLTTTPMRAAALATVRARLAWRRERRENLEMAFGTAQLGVVAARLGDAEAALLAAQVLATEHFSAAGVSTHDAGSIFNLDASGGLPSVIAEMLVQIDPGEIRVLPALPAAWPEGEVTGLAGRGGVIIDRLTWARGTAEAAIRFRPGTAITRPGDDVVVRPPARAADQRSLTVRLTGEVQVLRWKLTKDLSA